MFAPMQGAYEKETVMLVSLKMQTMLGSKRGPARTRQQTNPFAAITHSAANGNLRKFGASSRPVKYLHQCKVHMKRKLTHW